MFIQDFKATQNNKPILHAMQTIHATIYTPKQSRRKTETS